MFAGLNDAPAAAIAAADPDQRCDSAFANGAQPHYAAGFSAAFNRAANPLADGYLTVGHPGCFEEDVTTGRSFTGASQGGSTFSAAARKPGFSFADGQPSAAAAIFPTLPGAYRYSADEGCDVDFPTLDQQAAAQGYPQYRLRREYCS